MENGRASGIDGLPAEFYKAFWAVIGQDVLDVLRDSIRRGTLPLSCRRAVLTLLPKNGDLTHLKNWCPVSLLCTDCKLLSKALASRLTKVNWTKSEAILVGEWGGGQPSLPGGLAWKRGGFKYLGVYLGTNEFLNKNWEGSVEHMKGRLSRWKRLVPKMSYRGRMLVINNLTASSLWHKLACMDPPPNLLANIQAQLVDFFWDNLHWIPQSVLHLPKEEGGQGLVQLSSRAAAFRLQFIQRLLTGPRDLRDPESFPGQPRDIVSPTCPGFSTGSLPGEACPEHLPRETSRRHLKQMPEPPQLSPFDVEEQRLYSELLPGDRAPYPIAKGAPRHPTEEAHFGRLYPGSYPFGHDPELMTIVAASMPELMQLWSTCIYEEERHVDSSVNRVSCREMSRSRTARVKLFQVEKLVLFVISTPYNHIILGFPWLQTFPASPHHWKAWSPCTPIKSMEYHDLQEVFSKEKVTQLPPHQPCDCAIELLPNTMPPKSKIYPLLVPTTKAIESYIEEALAVGFIQPFISPAAAGFFYVEKKDGGLRPCIDYRRLNSITVCYPYLLPRVSSALEQLQETQFFTKLDLHGAFNLVQKPDPEHLREEIFLDRNLPRSAIQEGDKVQT
ncbi:hypothetical protein QTP86_033188 [Hemibagrus guttatus]|nr:hypothetical protein QTP86_033188 [Hemibagrus guttatus]